MPNNPELEVAVKRLKEGSNFVNANDIRAVLGALADTERRLTESDAELAITVAVLRQEAKWDAGTIAKLNQQLADSQAIGPCGKHPKSAWVEPRLFCTDCSHTYNGEPPCRQCGQCNTHRILTDGYCTTCREVSEAMRGEREKA